MGKVSDLEAGYARASQVLLLGLVNLGLCEVLKISTFEKYENGYGKSLITIMIFDTGCMKKSMITNI